jgi:hypothetical protein
MKIFIDQIKYAFVLSLLILCLTTLNIKAQNLTTIPIDPDTKLVTLQGIIEFPELKKDEIYSKIYNWFSERIKTQGPRPKRNDGRLKLDYIMIKMGIDSLYTSKSKIAFDLHISNDKMRSDNSFQKWKDGLEKVSLTIWIKDGKIKYEYSNFSHIAYSTGEVQMADILYETEKIKLIRESVWLEFRLNVLNAIPNLTDEIKVFINQSSKKDKQDW